VLQTPEMPEIAIAECCTRCACMPRLSMIQNCFHKRIRSTAPERLTQQPSMALVCLAPRGKTLKSMRLLLSRVSSHRCFSGYQATANNGRLCKQGRPWGPATNHTAV
jgi:hypothetical protein